MNVNESYFVVGVENGQLDGILGDYLPIVVSETKVSSEVSRRNVVSETKVSSEVSRRNEPRPDRVFIPHNPTPEEALAAYREAFDTNLPLVMYKIERVPLPEQSLLDKVKALPDLPHGALATIEAPKTVEVPKTQSKPRKNPRRPKYRYAIVKTAIDLLDGKGGLNNFGSGFRQRLNAGRATTDDLVGLLASASIGYDEHNKVDTAADYLSLGEAARARWGNYSTTPLTAAEARAKLKELLRLVR